MDNNTNLCMDWGDSIENDGQEFVILPEGDYSFKVTKFERGRFPGSQKLPACNKATITVEVDSKDGPATCKFDLILYRTLEWKICAFFRCIGQKKQGEKVVMDWNKVTGSTGMAHFKPRTYKTQNGEERTVNDIERFIDAGEKKNNDTSLKIDQDDLPF